MRYYILNIILICTSTLMSCGSRDGQTYISEIQNTGEYVTITKEQANTIGVDFSKLEYIKLSDVVTANGFLESPPQNKAKISSNVTGKVIKINYLVGDYVKKGSEIIRIESIEFLEMQNNYSIIKNSLKYLEDDYQRQKTLSEQNVNAKKVFLQAEKDYLSARTELETMNQKLDLLQVNRKEIEEGHITPLLSIRSPISGFVTNVNTVIGAFIDNHDILAEVINPDDLHAEINVYERDILKIRKGQEVEITIPQIEDLKISGEVVLIDRELDVDTRTATIHVDIPKNENLLSGMYVEANILLDEKKVMVVPQASLVREESRSFVYVLTNQSEQNYTLKKEFVNVGNEREGKAVIHFINAVDTTSMIAMGGVYYLSSKID